jgi:hypothetical protein
MYPPTVSQQRLFACHSDDQIPDKHLDTSLAYLKTVQGGARQVRPSLPRSKGNTDTQNLVKIAEQHVNPTSESAANAEQAAESSTEQGDGLEAEQAIAQEAASQSEEDKAEAERKAAVLRARGEKLLEVFQ